jgi:two-component system response regulator (stage 0 sporulation protein F)
MNASGPQDRNPSPESGAEPRRPRILLVEDDLHERNLLAWMLREEGWSVVEAKTGVELLEWIGIVTSSPRRIFDVIVSDIMMPDLSTLEVLSSWRYGDFCVPLIVVTAHDEPAIHSEARRLGATAVLQKPVQASELRNAVARALVRSPGSDTTSPRPRGAKASEAPPRLTEKAVS